MSLIPFHSDERADCADHTLFRTVPIGIVIAVETFPEVEKIRIPEFPSLALTPVAGNLNAT